MSHRAHKTPRSPSYFRCDYSLSRRPPPTPLPRTPPPPPSPRALSPRGGAEAGRPGSGAASAQRLIIRPRYSWRDAASNRIFHKDGDDSDFPSLHMSASTSYVVNKTCCIIVFIHESMFTHRFIDISSHVYVHYIFTENNVIYVFKCIYVYMYVCVRGCLCVRGCMYICMHI